MRYLLQFAILLAALADSTAFAADRIQLAQVVTPGQVQPVPLVPTPLISSQTSTGCLVGCDTAVMTCQNACVAAGQAAGVATATPSSGGAAACVLNCSTQQLLCKRACNQPVPNLR
jgi:hypothetical protein